MTHSKVMRWRSIVLRYVYGLNVQDIHAVLGMSVRSITRWNRQFKLLGHVGKKKRTKRGSRWSSDVIEFVNQYAIAHPCFYIEELQAKLKFGFPALQNTSASTICRALRFDLNLTRKILEKRARESSAHEVVMYRDRLEPFYSHPCQLVFVDETSKDGRDALRKYAWSRRNTPAVVTLPLSRGQRVLILAAFDCTGFIEWGFTEGTFDRNRFHQVMCDKIIPYLNLWPLPR
jgi:transposase